MAFRQRALSPLSGAMLLSRFTACRLASSARPSPVPSQAQLGTQPSAELQEEGVEADMAALGGNAQGAQAALASLEQSLRPVERYAIRFIEEAGCTHWMLCPTIV